MRFSNAIMVYMIQSSGISFQVHDIEMFFPKKHPVSMTSLVMASPPVRAVLMWDLLGLQNMQSNAFSSSCYTYEQKCRVLTTSDFTHAHM